jgi:hypothetical protein
MALLASGGTAFWDACLPTSATSRSPNRSQHIAKRGFASATLWTPEDRWNHRALDFYRHLGWTQEEVRAPGGDIRHRLVLQ